MRERFARYVQRAADPRALTTASFLESTVLPIPLELLVAPLMAGRKARAFLIAAWMLLGCVVGAMLFYGLGLMLFEPVVKPALDALGLNQGAEDMRKRIGEDGVFWTVFVISVTPFPLQLATLGAGVAKANFLVFLAAIVLSRGIRYFGLAAIMHFLGRPALRWFERVYGRGKTGERSADEGNSDRRAPEARI